MSLVVSAVAMLAYDLQNYRANSLDELRTLSGILAGVSAPALEFNDHTVGQENLAQLRTRPDISLAALYAADGALFAQYMRDPALAALLPVRPEVDGSTSQGGNVILFRRITRGKELIGTLYLSAQYPLLPRVQSYVALLGSVMAVSLLVAFLLSLWISRAITKPILAVTDAVHRVIGERDFTQRVQKSTDDEIGILVDAFNSMLGEVGERAQATEKLNAALSYSNDALEYSIAQLKTEVQERIAADDALKQLNNTLELRIAENTVALTKANDQLRHSQKMEAIGQLTGGVAHDFNNVLQIVSGNLQLLQMAPANDPSTERRLATAVLAADRGAKLAAQLLAFARRQPLRPVPVDLSRIVRNMDDLIRRALGETIKIETIVAGGLWNTLIDPNQIENVILNLSINARDAMPSGGRLTVELGNATLDEQYVENEPDLQPGEYVMLAITDNGTGMPPEVAARVFEPFYTTKKDGQGTGLGLSMAYGFVKQSYGHIVIDSEVGGGTTVRIYLPRAHHDEEQNAERRPPAVVGGCETVLVVEDDPAVQATAVDMLIDLGYDVLTAHDGESALTILRQNRAIDLLFTDVVMPGPVRSPDLAKLATELIPGITVLFTSGYPQSAIVHGGRLDPGVELISKPYRRDELARKIRHVLANRQVVLTSKGSDFLPVLSADTKTRAQRCLKILVVEDNPDALMMLEELLILLGHAPTCVGSAELALSEAETTHYEVLLTDQTLPGMSGVQLAVRMVQTQPELKIIFSSGYGDVALTLEFPYFNLPKPYTVEKLKEILERIS